MFRIKARAFFGVVLVAGLLREEFFIVAGARSCTLLDFGTRTLSCKSESLSSTTKTCLSASGLLSRRRIVAAFKGLPGFGLTGFLAVSSSWSEEDAEVDDASSSTWSSSADGGDEPRRVVDRCGRVDCRAGAAAVGSAELSLSSSAYEPFRLPALPAPAVLIRAGCPDDALRTKAFALVWTDTGSEGFEVLSSKESPLSTPVFRGGTTFGLDAGVCFRAAGGADLSVDGRLFALRLSSESRLLSSEEVLILVPGLRSSAPLLVPLPSSSSSSELSCSASL